MTPLRGRVRTIVRLAKDNPVPDEKTKMQQLFREYPYNLCKSLPVNLTLKNFYFANAVKQGDLLQIFKATDQNHPNPETDELYAEKEFSPLRHNAYSLPLGL